MTWAVLGLSLLQIPIGACGLLGMLSGYFAYEVAAVGGVRRGLITFIAIHPLEIGQKKVAAVTGASDGIGYELAKQFAEHGYDLLVAAEDPGIAEAAQAFLGFAQ